MIIALGTTPALQRVMTFQKLTLDTVNRTADVQEAAAGKAINAARVVHTLGEKVVATGFLGGDSGRRIRRDLDENHISHDFVEVTPATRTCVTVIDRAASNATELVEESKQVEPRAWDALKFKLTDLLPQADILMLCGTLTPGAPQDFYADCVRMANEANVRVILDARGEPLRRALACKPFLVKPNLAELAETVGMTIKYGDDSNEAIRRLLDRGPTWAVITMGADGAIVSDGKTSRFVVPPKVRAVSAIGSGDAFCAGLAVGLMRGMSVPEASVLGAVCGSANALTSMAGFVHLTDVEKFQREMRTDLD